MINSCRPVPSRAVGLALIGLLGLANGALAGTFIFYGEPGRVTHPPGYSASANSWDIRVCIAPTTVAAEQLITPLQNVLNTYNRQLTAIPNLVNGNQSGIPWNSYDVESVLLHEMGHCLGLGHTNMASESQLPASQWDFTKALPGRNGIIDLDPGPDGVTGTADDWRGDDENVHWFNIATNDPFGALPAVIDSQNYSVNLADLPWGESSVVNGSRQAAELLGYPPSEAVMNQGTYSGELQRQLIADDVATLEIAMSGIDRLANTNDDYRYQLVLEGISADEGCDIVVQSSSETGFAACQVSGYYVTLEDIAITSGVISLNPNINWYYNSKLSVDNPTDEGGSNKSDPGLAAALAIALDLPTDPVVAGERVIVDITVANAASAGSAVEVIATATLDEALGVQLLTNCPQPLDALRCRLGTLDPGSERQFSYILTSDPAAMGSADVALALTTASANVGHSSAQAEVIFKSFVQPPPEPMTVTLQNGLDGYSGSRDTSLYLFRPSRNWGADSELKSANGTFANLIHFAIFADQSGPIPVAAEIERATLSLYKHRGKNHAYALYSLTRQWAEDEANWFQAMADTPWQRPGAYDDYHPSAIATGTTTLQVGEWLEFDVTAAVQAIAQGGDNYGWLLRGVEAENNHPFLKAFCSSEESLQPYRPKLEVRYRPR